MNLDEIIEFVVEHGGANYAKMPYDDFVKAIKKHKEYGTLMSVRDKKGIAALARWNWINEEEVEILDCVVRKDLRGPRMIKYLIHLGFNKNPKAKYMKYQRYYKYPYRARVRMKVKGE